MQRKNSDRLRGAVILDLLDEKVNLRVEIARIHQSADLFDSLGETPRRWNVPKRKFSETPDQGTSLLFNDRQRTTTQFVWQATYYSENADDRCAVFVFPHEGAHRSTSIEPATCEMPASFAPACHI